MTERELFLTAILKCRREELYVNPRALSAEEETLLAVMESRRQIGEPVQYITGYCEFMGLPLNVDRRVLIPRPETEILVDSAIRIIKEQTGLRSPLRILDIGTGSGNIAVALAKFIENSFLTTLDISGEALTLARENAERNGVADRIDFVHASIHEFFMTPPAGEPFDVLISNPPYIPTVQLNFLPHDVQFEPFSALDGGEDGLYYYRQIMSKGGSVLKPGGFLFFEVGDTQAAKVAALFSSPSFSRNSSVLSSGTNAAFFGNTSSPPHDGLARLASHERETEPTSLFEPPQFIKDYTGMERVVWARKKIFS